MMLVALALILGLAQCKKNTEQNINENEGEKVYITLNVNQGNGSRLDVDPPHVVFQNGDKIYVASNGVYVGYLEYNGTNFSGSISDATEGLPLYFYLLGNADLTETLTAGSTTSCSVSISDQTTTKSVISSAPSNEDFGTTNTFTATLRNKCALAKFNVTTSSSAATCITGFNNKVTVSFSNNTLTPSKEGTGIIQLPAGSGEKWAILLPQQAMSAGAAGSAYSADGDYTGTCGAVPVINNNGYLTTGIAVTVTTEVNPGEVPTGAICGKFTINNNGDQMYFSQGNLQYIGSAAEPYWKFAENQWDYFGDVSAGQNVDRDLFGWGTSGWNNGNMYYQPYDTESFWDIETGYGYGPTDGTNYKYDLTGDYANADWGVYNAISNGGNTPNQWRTLTESEWYYVFYSRNTSSGIHYAKGIVNGVNGVILLPDNWTASVYALNYTNKFSAPYNTNEITAENWAMMENNGAVFLPAAGSRVGPSGSSSESHGCYWSASSFLSTSSSYRMSFDGLGIVIDCTYRFEGQSVRLVAPAEN
jgi:hypothetical protein